MGSKSVKSEKILEEAEVRTLVQELAAKLGLAEGLDLEPVDKLRLSVKLSGGKGAAKLKVYFPQDSAPEGAEDNGMSPGDATLKYSKLKKRMKKDFAALNTALAADQLPEESVVRSFLDDSHLMVSYPGYGDEYYLEYIKATKAFAKAWEARDVEKLKAGWQALNECKKSCHDKYK